MEEEDKEKRLSDVNADKTSDGKKHVDEGKKENKMRRRRVTR